MNLTRQQITERWERKHQLLAAHAETWERFRQMAARLFTARLSERDKPLTRRPPWSMRLTATGDPPAYLAVRPRYDAPPRWTGKPGTLSPEELEIEFMVGRLQDARDSERRAFGYELRATLRPGAATCRRYSITFGEEAIERAASVAKDFVTDPAQLLALSSDHCCLCGRGLTDEQSRSRGVGPECIRFLNSLVGTISDRKAQAVFAEWMAEPATT